MHDTNMVPGCAGGSHGTSLNKLTTSRPIVVDMPLEKAEFRQHCPSQCEFLLCAVEDCGTRYAEVLINLVQISSSVFIAHRA